MVGQDEKPALQVIVLGSGGGPKEDNTSAFFVHSTSSEWKRGSVLAVDAGVHLSAVQKILETHMPNATGDPPKLLLTSGPFAGLELPHKSAFANASFITRTMIDTYLITHPHLDHISGFVVNTAGLPASRPKRLAGLPATIAAFRTHIFNNVIWPNLSDENNGVGLVTYMRLVDGGSSAIGDGDGKGYVEICEGLSTRLMSVSHGHCLEQHTHRGSITGAIPFESPTSPHSSSNSLHPHRKGISPDRYARRNSNAYDEICVYDSSAYFIRDIATGREVLIFGDVEPDSISLSPRNLGIWKEAGSKIASGALSAIFIECSYGDSQDVDHLYGHLSPRYLIEEMKMLASCVIAAHKQEREPRKRKRSLLGPQGSEDGPSRRSHRGSINGVPQSHLQRLQVDSKLGNLSTSTPVHLDSDTSMTISDSSPPVPVEFLTSPKTNMVDRSISISSGMEHAETGDVDSAAKAIDGSSTPVVTPLKGLKIVVIHVKNTGDDEDPGECIMKELLQHEAAENLGCEFVLAEPGMSVYV